MAQRFQNPNEQFSDATGLPLEGAALYFYESGTTTALSTYSDVGLTIANPNPVILDSAGRAGSIFLLPQAYRVVLADNSGQVQWTEDPVAGGAIQLTPGGGILTIPNWVEKSITTSQILSLSSSYTVYVALAALGITLPPSSGLNTQWTVRCVAIGGAVTISPNGADAINGGTAGVPLVISQGSQATLTTDADGNIYAEPSSGPVRQQTVSGAFTVAPNGFYVATAALTATIPSSATLGNGLVGIVYAMGGPVTLAPSGSDQINGGGPGQTLVIPTGAVAIIGNDGDGNISAAAIPMAGAPSKIVFYNANGSYTYTPTVGIAAFLVLAIGPGGPGGPTGTISPTATTIGPVTCNPGQPPASGNPQSGGLGGTATGGDINITGATGGITSGEYTATAGGLGASSVFFGGGGMPSFGPTVLVPGPGTAPGAGGGGQGSFDAFGGAGGGAGGFAMKLIAGSAIAPSYPVVVGPGGTGGGAGGAGADGAVLIIEYGGITTANSPPPWETDYQAPTTGFSITIPAYAQTLALNPAGTLAAGTVIMPTAPIDGQIARIASTKTITALTVSPNAGQTLDGAPTTIAANSSVAWQYNAANAIWFRLY